METVNKAETDYKESKRHHKKDREWKIFVKEKLFYAKLSKKKIFLKAISKKCYIFLIFRKILLHYID